MANAKNTKTTFMSGSIITSEQDLLRLQGISDQVKAAFKLTDDVSLRLVPGDSEAVAVFYDNFDDSIISIHANIAICELSDRELMCVFAHEFHHHKDRSFEHADAAGRGCAIATIATMVFLVFGQSLAVDLAKPLSLYFSPGSHSVVNLLISMIWPIVSTGLSIMLLNFLFGTFIMPFLWYLPRFLGSQAVSRLDEFKADQESAEMVSVEDTISALEKVEKSTAGGSAVRSAFSTIIFRTHPSVEERIHVLKLKEAAGYFQRGGRI